MRIERFAAGDAAALASWTGEPVDRVDADGDDWVAWEGRAVVGFVHPWPAPDGKLRIYFGRTRPDAYGPLAAAFPGECYAMVDDPDGVDELRRAGFRVSRRESIYEIPVALIDAAAPPGVDLVTADQVEPIDLARLDAALREDVPGSQGWQVDLDFFTAQTYDSPDYNPATYIVARSEGRLIGLARIWTGPQSAPRLGLIGVLTGHRRRGLARALLAAAFDPLVERGDRVVTAEVDTTNRASNALLTGLGGQVTGETTELFRGASDGAG